MPRTVAALYDSRVEAERASLRLSSQFKIRPGRIIARDTVAAVDDLRISPDDADFYREQLGRGAHLFVAQIPTRTSPARVIELLEEAALGGSERGPHQQSAPVKDDVGVTISDDQHDEQADAPDRVRRGTDAGPSSQAAVETATEPEFEAVRRATPVTAAPISSEGVQQGRGQGPEEELRIGQPRVAGGGARVRSFSHDALAEEDVSLRDEVIEIESRPCERRLTESEIAAGGLFKERTFEATEMREEPVVTKVPVIREEVIVRKTIRERNETIRETVRQTDIQVEDLPPSEAEALFARPRVPEDTGYSPHQQAPESDRVDQRGGKKRADAEAGGEQDEGAHSSAWF
jgi:stress response protein YsnF